MATDSNWKDKYLNALEASETTERKLKEAEETLRLAVSRLTLAASGSDQQLDQQLSKLKTLIRKSPESSVIRSLLEEISVNVKRLDIELNAGKPQRLPPQRFLELLLRKINFPQAQKKQARALEKQLGKKDALQKLESHLSKFISLISETIESAGREITQADNDKQTDTAEPKVSIKKLADELYIQLRKRLTERSQLKPTCSQLGRASTESELENAVSKLVQLLPRDLKRNETLDGTLPLSPSSSPEERLGELLDKLTLPDELANKASNIRSQLDTELKPADWPPLLSSFADLVAQMRSEVEREKSELQAFLLQLTTELQNIDVSLISTEERRMASFNSGKELDEAVRSNLTELQTSVDNETDLGNLRQILSHRMEKIGAHLEEYRNTEAKRQQEISAEVESLRSRLRAMEDETTELNDKLETEREQARTDPLTGINNRIAYEQRLDQEYSRWRNGETGLSIIVCDVDHFKKLNDTLGHQAGDKALQSIARVLKQNVRKNDMLARYGGEEFVVLVAHEFETDSTIAKKIAEKIRSDVEEAEFKSKGKRIPITISCGYSSFQEGDERDAPFDRADQSLYRAKELGRNRVEG